MKLSSLVIFTSLSMAAAWAPVSSPRTFSRVATTSLKMGIDYNDPMVMEEFNNVQPMTYEEVEEELQGKGIRASASMNEMDVKLMLVEVRLRFSGQLGADADKPKKKKPVKFSSKFEEAMWTKPAFEEFYNAQKAKGDHNAQNVISEYLTDPAMAKTRYAKTYKALIRECEAALKAPAPVKTTTIQFTGFPANMGEGACKMTLEAMGAIVSFECELDEDFPVLKGKVTFEDIESAKKAVAEYDGMDMGMGSALELSSV
jgi:hypothetical protein